MKYKISIENREYTDFALYNVENYNIIKDNINPIDNKLFNGDVFTIENNNIIIEHSVVKSLDNIPGVLLINDMIMGRTKDKFLYKCIPDDKRLPYFIIPFKEKGNSFSKVKNNRYITFKFANWNNKHPEGYIMNNIGTVEDLIPYYEYQLYCKCLNHSMQKFTNDFKNSSKSSSVINYIHDKYNFQDRRDKNIFTIDSPNTSEFDDAYGIEVFDDYTILSIYITNVAVIIDTLQLWKSFTERISTIYLPDKKRPMLPTLLSSSLCSLTKNKDRIVFAMDIIFKNDTIDIEFNNCIINVKNNFVYNDPILKKTKDYKLLSDYVRILHKIHKFSSSINISEDIISYLMMFMNYKCSTKFVQYKSGIFRSSSFKEPKENIPDELLKFIQIFNSSAGVYTTDVYKPHELLKFDSYLHITSPIRRIVDLLNSMVLLSNEKLFVFTNEAHNFYDQWIQKLDYINKTSRIIRKIQYDCNLLNHFYNDNNLSYKIFKGYIFDKLYRNDGLIQYTVYIPELKMVSRLTINIEYDNYSKHDFSIHIIKNTDSFKKKVRLHIKQYK